MAKPHPSEAAHGAVVPGSPHAAASSSMPIAIKARVCAVSQLPPAMGGSVQPLPNPESLLGDFAFLPKEDFWGLCQVGLGLSVLCRMLGQAQLSPASAAAPGIAAPASCSHDVLWAAGAAGR